MDNDFFYMPMIGEDVITTFKIPVICKQYVKGDPFMSKPYKMKFVSYVDAESSQSGTETNDDGIVLKFVCDRCKKPFKADKAHAINLYLNTAPLTKDSWLSRFKYERAYCGRCYKKAEKLSAQIYDAICEFDPEIQKSRTEMENYHCEDENTD